MLNAASVRDYGLSNDALLLQRLGVDQIVAGRSIFNGCFKDLGVDQIVAGHSTFSVLVRFHRLRH